MAISALELAKRAKVISGGATLSAPHPTAVERGYGALDAIMRPLYSAIGMDERSAYQNAQRLSRGIEDILGLNETELSVRRLAAGKGRAEDYAGAALAVAPFAVKPLAKIARKSLPRVARYLTEPLGVAEQKVLSQPLALPSPAPSSLKMEVLPPAPPLEPVRTQTGAIPIQDRPKGALSLTHKPFEYRNTRGEGVQYHGARGDLPELTEGYYNPANIYGGMDTFYTTDAADVASGYKRRNQSGKLFQVKPRGDYRVFDMEKPLNPDEAEQLLGTDYAGLVPMAIDEAALEHGRKANLRQIMDMMRDLSGGEGVSRDEVQEIFGTAIDNLRQQGYGGMRHIGGLKTGRDPHNVTIYFDAPSQLDFTEPDLDALRVDNPRFQVRPKADSRGVIRDADGRVLSFGRKP